MSEINLVIFNLSPNNLVRTSKKHALCFCFNLNMFAYAKMSQTRVIEFHLSVAQPPR